MTRNETGIMFYRFFQGIITDIDKMCYRTASVKVCTVGGLLFSI